MALQGDGKWLVQRGDCLWNIAKACYGNPYRWTEIADRNGINRRTALIYPNQRLIIPGKTPSSNPPAPSSPAPAPNYSRSVSFQWFALDAGTTRAMFAVWTYDRPNTKSYQVNWDYDTGAGGWRVGNHSTTTDKQSAYSAPENAKKVRLTVKPISDNWSDGATVTKEYDYSNNPPELPPAPSFEINQFNKLMVTLENIEETINADSIEIAIYQDDTFKYQTAKVAINKDARFAKYECQVDPGHSYKVRCRAVRGTIYGGWTEFTDNDMSVPVAPSEITTLRPQVISEQTTKIYGVFIEWPEVSSAKTYLVEWTTNEDLFGTDQVNSQQTEEGKGPRLLITNIELGHRYFFRVASINDKGQSVNYTSVKSVTLGTRPAAPTTYSNVVSCIVGEDLNLYWVHNSTDGSIESYARLNIEVTDSAHPELQPLIITKVIENNKPEDSKDKTSVYTINTNDPEWATVGEGYSIKWKVQTAGITSEYSEWSIEREANIYAKPEVEIDLQNNDGQSVEEINQFPFYISVTAKPAAQTPISYYIEILANEAYQTVDHVGKVKMVNIGDKVYQKYYDPQQNPWKFLLEMTPGILDLENNISYTINVTVSMNSGLTVMSSFNFTAYFNDLFYDVYADVIINKETYEASIHPYCNKYTVDDSGNRVPSLVENCKLTVYRREYDGTFLEIASDINNEPNLYVTDPHPSLDYARYRVVAKTNDTGAISYADIPAIKFGETAVIIQWAEEWSSFESTDSNNSTVEPAWAGSLLRLPYNITVQDSKNVDVSLIKYAGRKRPVSYYGTQLGESASWTTEIPKDDKELLYALRRLASWTGDVYVREPSGTGYWANVSVSYNLKYSDVIVPVSLSITRVEGGI